MTLTLFSTVHVTQTFTALQTDITVARRGENLGPLTTIFTPPSGCDACYVEAESAGSACAVYFTDCHSPRPCMPGSAPWKISDFYSPGLFCPSGWTTATVVSANMTDSIRATEVLSRLSHDETAAFCCPDGFTFTYGSVIPSFVTIPPLCLSTLIEGNLVYHVCGTDGSNGLRTAAVGTSTITTAFDTAWTDTQTIRLGPDPSLWVTTTQIFNMHTTATTRALKDATMEAPGVQLVWRPEDRPLTENPDFSQSTIASRITTGTLSLTPSPGATSTAGTPLTTGIITGIAVAATTFATFLLLVIAFCIRRHRRKAKEAPAAPDNNARAQPDNNTGKERELGPSQKPELDATCAADTNRKPMGKQELPAESVTTLRPSGPQAFELDAGPITPELPAKEGTFKFSANRRGLPGIPESPPAQVTPNPVSPLSQQSSPQPPHMFSSPSLMSSVGGHDSYLAEGWRASMLRD